MLNITFIRHTESEYNKKGLLSGRIDCNLTEEGIHAAKEIRETLIHDFDIIYCSPLKRTKQTLDAIFSDCKPIYDDRVIERTFGIYEGKPKNSVSKEQLELYKKGLWLAPGAESIKEIDKRVCDFVGELFKKYHNNERILVVTHDGILNSIKRNFIKKCTNEWTNNLGILTINDKDYEYYQESTLE